jgi:hypothetical protein
MNRLADLPRTFPVTLCAVCGAPVLMDGDEDIMVATTLIVQKRKFVVCGRECGEFMIWGARLAWDSLLEFDSSEGKTA